MEWVGGGGGEMREDSQERGGPGTSRGGMDKAAGQWATGRWCVVCKVSGSRPGVMGRGPVRRPLTTHSIEGGCVAVTARPGPFITVHSTNPPIHSAPDLSLDCWRQSSVVQAGPGQSRRRLVDLLLLTGKIVCRARSFLSKHSSPARADVIRNSEFARWRAGREGCRQQADESLFGTRSAARK